MHADWRWRWLDTFDCYTRYQWKFLTEVHRWFLECGFQDIHLRRPDPHAGTRKAARKPGPRGAADASVEALA
jgi:hypothetical protein